MTRLYGLRISLWLSFKALNSVNSLINCSDCALSLLNVEGAVPVNAPLTVAGACAMNAGCTGTGIGCGICNGGKTCGCGGIHKGCRGSGTVGSKRGGGLGICHPEANAPLI